MIFPETCVFFAHFCFRDESFNIGGGGGGGGGRHVHLGGGEGSDNFWPYTGGSDVNNLWSRGVVYFRHIGGVCLEFSFHKKCLSFWGTSPQGP